MGIIPRKLGSLRDAQLQLTFSAEQMQTLAMRREAEFRNLGLRARDRLILAHGNSVYFYVDLLAAWRIGASVVPVDPQLTDVELRHLVQFTEARAVCALSNRAQGQGSKIEASEFEIWLSDAFDLQQRLAASALSSGATIGKIPEVAENAEVAETGDSTHQLDDPALILFTSGSSQAPKGVVHSFRGVLAKLNIFHTVMPADEWARTLVILPTHFVYGLMSNSLAPWFQGCDLVVYPSFDLSTLAHLGDILRKERITAFCSVPSMWKPIFQFAPQLKDAPDFRRVHCAAAPLSRELWQQIKAWAPGIEVKNVYGATEMGCAITGPPDGHDFHDGDIGQGWGTQLHVGPHPTQSASIDELSEIWLQGPSMMLGYYKRPDLSAEVLVDGWYRTGDLGVRNQDGQVTHRGRVNFVINKSGMKIHPEDVEAALSGHPDVADCAAWAWPDPLAGEVVAVALVARDANQKWQDTDWRGFEAWLRQRLAPYKLPTIWMQAASLPRTERGKLQRARLVEMFVPQDLRATRVDSEAKSPDTPQRDWRAKAARTEGSSE
ncbi:MAG TPA: class I adenylate-forming enzyme family protein [Pseudobdellovibrionaceae bacterium]|nr:class I adenylate-forming enzyme family protein [Pseudobdellovibrionaceae bacterium]